jgi:hypothetical protein
MGSANGSPGAPKSKSSRFAVAIVVESASPCTSVLALSTFLEFTRANSNAPASTSEPLAS